MKSLRIAAMALAVATTSMAAVAQGNPPSSSAAGSTGAMPMNQPMSAGEPSGMPTEAGQAAFGAIQEIVGILLADPKTDWSKVNINALRQHLIDMDEVTMRANANAQPIPGGVRIMATGRGRTLEAIQRMVPAHAMDINGLYGWTVQAKAIPNGEELAVTTSKPADVQKIRALGFMGIMVLGTHQMHHLEMAKGEPMDMPGMH
jgi:hypothetical protein